MTAHQAPSYGPGVTADDRSPGTQPAAETPIPQYEIRIKGHLGPRWSAWFDGLTLTTEADGTTVIAGPVADQAALHGVLQRLRDVGVHLVSLHQLSSDATTEPRALDTTEGN